MTPDALRAELTRLGLSQIALSRLLAIDDRTVRRWAAGELPVPRAVVLLLPRLSSAEAAALVGAAA
jgi:DNA-binding transcriptional regulator YiaG